MIGLGIPVPGDADPNLPLHAGLLCLPVFLIVKDIAVIFNRPAVCPVLQDIILYLTVSVQYAVQQAVRHNEETYGKLSVIDLQCNQYQHDDIGHIEHHEEDAVSQHIVRVDPGQVKAVNHQQRHRADIIRNAIHISNDIRYSRDGK